MEGNYIINPYGKNPILNINKHIGYDSDEGYGICGIEFSKEILNCDSCSPDLITIVTNSMGGSVKDGFDILNAILNCKSETLAILQGFAFSTAGWCTLGAKKVIAYDYTIWMCHLPYNPENEEEKSPFLDIVCSSICKIISEKSGRNGKKKLTIDEVSKMLSNKTYMTASEMYEIGIIDKVITSNGEVERVEIDKNEILNATNYYKKYQLVVNKYIDTQSLKKEKMEYPKVANRLKLNANSSEDAIIEAISSIENKVEVLNSEKQSLIQEKTTLVQEKNELSVKVSNLETEKTQAVNKVTSLEAEIESLKTAKETAENKIKESEDLVVKEKASNLIKSFVECGKIKNEPEIIGSWEKRAVLNFEDTRLILETMPTNAKLPKPEIQKQAQNKEGSSVLAKMKKEKYTTK